MIELSDKISIVTGEYAIQGNAVLGIRDSGKSWTSTYMAEQLLDAGIPFIAFDPIHVWYGLKYGKDGQKGYEVVVAASENVDIDLTIENTEDIVRAAMVENVPLILDLFSVQWSKADIKKIVLAAINVLLYENEPHGVRHVFIEEAADFVPQQIRSGGEAIYSAFDKLGRMGGNQGLGYTLINQRAADVNKSILELTNTLFLHKQTGSNTIAALEKWMKVTGTENAKGLAAELATLQQGECFVWLPGQTNPEFVKIPEKKTIHPDRRKPQLLKNRAATDVTSFLNRLQKSLATKPEPQQPISVPKGFSDSHEDPEALLAPRLRSIVEELESTVKRLELSLSAARSEAEKERTLRMQLDNIVAGMRKTLEPYHAMLTALFSDLRKVEPVQDKSKWDIWLTSPKIKGQAHRILELMIERRRLTKKQIALLVGTKPNNGHFNNCLGLLRSSKLLVLEGDEYILQEIE